MTEQEYQRLAMIGLMFFMAAAAIGVYLKGYDDGRS